MSGSRRPISGLSNFVARAMNFEKLALAKVKNFAIVTRLRGDGFGTSFSTVRRN
jgi:hypothetical protein